MINVPFEEPQTKKWKRWLKDASKGMEEIVNLAAAEQPYIIKDSMYKRRREEIFAAFSGKCAYCESNISADQPGDVEHFRPKGGIVDENDKPVYLLDKNGNRISNPDGTSKLHPGYYWLAYSWQNLLPSCAQCNRPNKRTRFPVKGFRADSPGNETKEDPLLLHPLVDDPSEHFSIKHKRGVLVDKTEKGKISMKLLDLNRAGLLEERKSAYTAMLARIKVANYESEDPEIAENDLIESLVDTMKEVIKCREGKIPYSFAARHAFSEHPELLERFEDLLSEYWT